VGNGTFLCANGAAEHIEPLVLPKHSRAIAPFAMHCTRLAKNMLFKPSQDEPKLASQAAPTSRSSAGSNQIQLCTQHLAVSSSDSKKSNLLTDGREVWQSNGSKPHTITITLPISETFGRLDFHGGRDDKSYFAEKVRPSFLCFKN
jgi:hypothetical protein